MPFRLTERVRGPEKTTPSVKENVQVVRSAQSVTSNVGLARIGVEPEIRQSIEQRVEASFHLHSSKVHPKTPVRSNVEAQMR